MISIRLFGFIGALGIISSLSNAQVNDYPGALIVDANSPTKFMMGYAVWWGTFTDGGSYRWNDPSQYDPAYNAAHRDTETQALEHDLAIDFGPYQQRILAIPEDGSNEVRYSSNDATTIQRHLGLFNELGIDIVVLDVTNGISNLFGGATPMLDNMHLKATSAIYSIYNNPNNPVRIVPAVGCQKTAEGQDVDLAVSSFDNKTPLQRSLEWMLERMRTNPHAVVLYEGKPLVIIYIGVSGYTPNQVLQGISADLQSKLTIRIMVGYSDDQPSYWDTPNLSTVASKYQPYTRLKGGVWTWADRFYNGNPGRDSFISYTLPPGAGIESRMEFSSMNGMSAPHVNAPLLPYREGANYHQMLTVARRGNPIFVFNSHFNFFLAHDSGFTKALSRDVEPNNLWHRETFEVVKSAIASYRAYQSGAGTPRFLEVTSRGLSGGSDQLITGLTISGPANGAMQRVVGKAIGPTLTHFGLSASAVAADPRLDLATGAGALIARNDSWNVSSDLPSGQVSLNQSRAYKNSTVWLSSLNYGFPMAATEAALTADLQPGTYTFVDYENSGTSRIAHLRVNTLDEIGPSIIMEVSARSRVETGDRILFTGFTIDRQMTVLIQGRGPSLAAFGLNPVLANPELFLFNNSGSVVQSDADIGNDPARKAQIEAITGWTLTANECAFIVTLPPGTYTVQLRNQSPATSANGIGFLSARKL